MEFKGTPGEWYLGDDCNIMSRVVDERVKKHSDEGIRKNESGEIAQCWEDFHDGTIKPREECLYNALLITRAPKMLELIKEFLSYLESGDMLEAEIMLHTKCKNLIHEATHSK